jgi:CO/xanthine dehydrogenase FAD-binding subunit
VEAALIGAAPDAASFAGAATRARRGALALRDNRFKTALLPALVERALRRAAA